MRTNDAGIRIMHITFHDIDGGKWLIMIDGTDIVVIARRTEVKPRIHSYIVALARGVENNETNGEYVRNGIVYRVSAFSPLLG